ncbi:phosphatidylinositol-glycan biosynthesis class X protein [Iris pallida]|uniref:Phosphatidylinositol-glycan biosynthesis class X protein n=1 Tax=Iris pallida TaxID=29817 RepID=A0AAX6GYD0_IRIPA|nr:phosphatidylinositol-glycan biosynthesis class X protein [Iris pallida]
MRKSEIFLLHLLLISSTSADSNPVDSSPGEVGSCNVHNDLVGNCQPNLVGCLPCSRGYLTSSYFKNHNTVLGSESYGFLDQEIGSDGSCKGLDNNIIAVGLSDLNRHLSGEGSHRQLISTMKFDVPLDHLSWFDDHFCEVLIIERLPVGVFADPFELQHLVQRRVFVGASVFGDTNLELPSALSNRSVVEIHINIGHNISSSSIETVVQLPLHARYPPLDASGYAKVTIGKPDLFLRCKPKELHYQACSWTIVSLGARSASSVVWLVPCGDGAVAGVVSSITLVASLVCSLLIVSSAVCFSRNEDRVS